MKKLIKSLEMGIDQAPGRTSESSLTRTMSFVTGTAYPECQRGLLNLPDMQCIYIK